MKIIIYEYVTGGGYADQPLPMSILAEGYAMLRCITADLKAAGHEVTVLLDSRISKLNPPLNADFTVPIQTGNEPERFIQNIMSINDAIYLIAPETNQTLQKLVKSIEATGKTCLNCTSNAIAAVADKAKLYEFLKQNNYPTPKTLTLNTDESTENIQTQITNNLTFPIIIKPTDGTSGNAISKIKNAAEIELATQKIKKQSKNKQFIAQEYIEGLSASISIISNGQKATSVSLNKQQITLSSPEAESSYEGGCVPMEHPLKQKAFSLAERLVEAFPGLHGYVGVDVILSEDKPYIIDVNPRLTTSYVGLHAVADFNVAQAIVSSITEAQLPKQHGNHQVAFFEKMQSSPINLAIFHKTEKLDTIITPPFPIGDTTVYTLVLTKGDSMQNAYLRLEEAKKALHTIMT